MNYICRKKYPRPATNWQNAVAKLAFPLDASEGSLDGSASNCVTKMDSVVNQYYENLLLTVSPLKMRFDKRITSITW